ncbi:uncharacterized protein [Porites lutea]|uniref:uncharacterized protein isoform X1 n=1 Tax=Porites lutea TaxID=51062 RepID=UPI003CC53393
MEKRSLGLVLALVTIFISLPLLLAKPNNKNKGDCPKPRGKDCTTEEDREIMRCCLEKYKKGFDDLRGQGSPLPGQDPPTCQTDLDLAECLSKSKCYAGVNNALRLLILNQLVFTKRVRICQQKNFSRLLEEAEKEHLTGLSNIKEMESLSYDQCAEAVYLKCGREFREVLQSYPDGFRPSELCSVYLREGNCNTREARKENCTESAVLKRFKDNSFKAARVVLPALCSLPDKAKRGH